MASCAGCHLLCALGSVHAGLHLAHSTSKACPEPHTACFHLCSQGCPPPPHKAASIYEVDSSSPNLFIPGRPQQCPFPSGTASAGGPLLIPLPSPPQGPCPNLIWQLHMVAPVCALQKPSPPALSSQEQHGIHTSEPLLLRSPGVKASTLAQETLVQERPCTDWADGSPSGWERNA